jgi:hypothetical protein
VTGIRVVGDGKEASTLGQLTLLRDLVVEVVDDRNAHSLGTSLDPILGQLVSVARVDGIQLVTQVVDTAHDGFEVPALATLGDPSVHIVTERSEGDEGVVRGATTEDLSSRVSDVTVAVGLLGCGIVVVEVTAEERQPLSKVKNIVKAEVRGAALDHKDLALREVGRETRGQNTTSCAAAHDDVVVSIAGGSGKELSSHGAGWCK